MNQQNYNSMVDMLINATKSQKISWQEDVQRNAFYTQINGCKITISSAYEITIDESSYSLSLANPNGDVFCTYSFSESTDKDEYEKLKTLYSEIRDVVYRITESENLILKGLEKALTTQNDADDFPF